MTLLTLDVEPVIIVPSNPNRTILLITNLSATTVYVFPTGGINEFVNRAWPIKEYGVFDSIKNLGCYTGPIYAMTSAASDIRVFEA